MTDVKTVGNDDEFASASIEVWVEIDGQPVLVSSDDGGTGHVVFCDRKYQRKTTLFDDEDATIETFFSTRSAHGFNWVALNVGSATHTIEVKAELREDTSSSDATADAVVGNRTLFVEPIKAANDEVVQPPPPTPTPSGGILGGVL